MRRFLMLLVLSLAFAAGVVVVAGCGGGGGTTAGETAAPSETPVGDEGSDEGATVEIDMENTAFVPADTEVKVGDMVVWENYDDVDHNVVAESGADFKSDDFGKDGTFEWVATKPGTVEYVCTIHPGMDGTLEVVE
jgi:plastocyanin